ncbi:MAG: c-type cytochrome [Pseudomonadota bacterium]
MVRYVVFGTISAAILLGGFLVSPPLKTEAVPVSKLENAMRFLSEPAQAGATAFADQCSDCHGFEGEGTGSAPSLTQRSYSKDFRNAEAFHTSVGAAAAAHNAARSPERRSATQEFNQLELMGKFLREVRERNDRRS